MNVYVGLGSNLGDSEALLMEAMERLPGKTQCSRLYHTSPVSPIPQAPYLNGVVHLSTRLEPDELLLTLLQIERELGQGVKAKHAPRRLDLDLLFYDQILLDSPLLSLPHPRWAERLFVLIPLRELTDYVWVGSRLIPLDPLIAYQKRVSTDTVELYKPTAIL